MGRHRSWTDDDLRRAVSSSASMAGVLRHLQLHIGGGTYDAVKRRTAELGIDTSHLLGKAWSRGRSKPRACKYNLEDLLVADSEFLASALNLRKRLLKEAILEHRCQRCSGTVWNGQPIPLQLDHRNGDNRDHRLTNLRLLCPNCHSQTDTWCGKNIKKSAGVLVVVPHCVDCRKPNSAESLRCKSCAGKCRATKIEWPNIPRLKAMVAESSYSAVGRKLGVSDNAIRKRIHNHGRVA